ncbi:arylamine N-acetyltransferase [Allocatelliglobosispora scoriae]|uniref:Arylamine N-acetyltransferase n=1 Tax=Allocatelliglobosispora scoriae TaxID=643052 RepID=A0A841BLN9_9ACTN|nr:arylamine N-acetyltransferase [Allocatelliglobosispora scoriae]MBB5867893.1 arylamine N-acetyltransferase [Allocatelliglobosispora scoriae]
MDGGLVDAYLRRLGVTGAAPSPQFLARLHAAHVERATYTNLQIIRSAPVGIEPVEAAREIVEGRHGYCFQLNSAFAWLLEALGFTVTLHSGLVPHVPKYGQDSPALTHLTILVHDLDGTWFVDVGLGDGMSEPLPLRAGSYRQGPFEYRLEPTPTVDGWRFVHDPRGSFAYMQFSTAPVGLADFYPAHRQLSGAAGSPYKKYLLAQSRRPDRVETMRGCVFTVLGADGPTRRVIDDPESWRATLVELGLADDGLLDLWPDARAASLHLW